MADYIERAREANQKKSMMDINNEKPILQFTPMTPRYIGYDAKLKSYAAAVVSPPHHRQTILPSGIVDKVYICVYNKLTYSDFVMMGCIFFVCVRAVCSFVLC